MAQSGLTWLWYATGIWLRVLQTPAGYDEAGAGTEGRRNPWAQDPWLPITPLVLLILGQMLVQSASQYDQLLVWAACCLGFFALLRSGEITVPAGTPTPLDIAVDSQDNPTALKIHLKASKMDPMLRDGSLHWTDLQHPVPGGTQYFSMRGFDQGPLFCTEDKTPLTEQALVARVRSTLEAAGLDTSQYSGHSFRIGATIIATANGVNDATIQMLGGDSAVTRTQGTCMRTPRHTLTGISRVLAS